MRARVILTVLLLTIGAPSFAGEPGTSAYDFAFTSIEGEPLPFSVFQGTVVLVVNTASRCGFTHQYAGLQDVWERYRDRDFVLLGVPSNDFGGQEPGTEAEIKTFCEVNFDVDFPMTTKVRVKGAGAHDFYKWAAAQVGAAGTPRWNFHKYLIGPDGRLVTWFPTPTEPMSREVTAAIEQQLSQAQASGG